MLGYLLCFQNFQWQRGNQSDKTYQPILWHCLHNICYSCLCVWLSINVCCLSAGFTVMNSLSSLCFVLCVMLVVALNFPNIHLLWLCMLQTVEEWVLQIKCYLGSTVLNMYTFVTGSVILNIGTKLMQHPFGLFFKSINIKWQCMQIYISIHDTIIDLISVSDCRT